MSFLLNLGSIETFFSDELYNLEQFTDFLSSDFVNFFNTVYRDVEDITSNLSQLLTNMTTYTENAVSSFVKDAQAFVSGLIPEIESALKVIANVISQLANDLWHAMLDLGQSLYQGVVQLSNALGQFGSMIIGDFFNSLQTAGLEIANALPSILGFLQPFVTPMIIAKGFPKLSEKLSDLLPEIELDLAPIGLGIKVPVKLGELAESVIDMIADFLKDVNGEIVDTFRESLKEPFISNFKISLRQIFNEIGLGDLPFKDPNFTDIAKWVAVRSFEEIRDHLGETLYLTGFPAWFTNAYLEPPVDDYVPRNPLFRPLDMRTLLTAVYYGFEQESLINQLAYNNLTTPKSAKLMYRVNVANQVKNVVLGAVRQFLIKPEEAYNYIVQLSQLYGKELQEKIFELEYGYATKRVIRQFARSLLSRALSNFGRPYLDTNELFKVTDETFKLLNYPEELSKVLDTFITLSIEIQANQQFLTRYLRLVSLGIYNRQEVERVIKERKLNREVAEFEIEFEYQYAYLHALISYLTKKLSAFLMNEKDFEHEMKRLGLSEDFISIYSQEYYTLQLAKVKENALLKLADIGVINIHEFEKLGLDKEYVKTLTEARVQELSTKAQMSIIQLQLENFLIDPKKAESELKKLGLLDQLISETVYRYYNVNLLKLMLRQIETNLRQFLITPAQALQELKGLGISDEVAKILVNIYTPDLISIREVINYLAEAKLYKVGKVVVDTSGLEQEIRQLGVSDEMARALVNYYALRFGVEEWRRYIPNISVVERAIRYNYDISKILKYAFIPPEFLDLYTDFYRYELVAEQVQSMKTLLVELSEYNASYPGLKELLLSYGVNESLQQVLEMEGKVRRYILMLTEMTITPSKALSMSEYLPNPTEFLKNVFAQYNVPPELQATYLQYARNRRLSRYVGEIISTLSYLAERKKIDIGQAQSILQQLKQYGLTDDEINLILFNIQLRLQA